MDPSCGAACEVFIQTRVGFSTPHHPRLDNQVEVRLLRKCISLCCLLRPFRSPHSLSLACGAAFWGHRPRTPAIAVDPASPGPLRPCSAHTGSSRRCWRSWRSTTPRWRCTTEQRLVLSLSRSHACALVAAFRWAFAGHLNGPVGVVESCLCSRMLECWLAVHAFGGEVSGGCKAPWPGRHVYFLFCDCSG